MPAPLSEWQLITISLFMREMDSAFLCQTEAIDIPRIVPGEGKPTAKCSFRNNLQSVGQALVQPCGPCWFWLIREQSTLLRLGLEAAGARSLMSSWERTLQRPGISLVCPGCWELQKSWQVGEEGTWRGGGCFPCPPPPSLLSDPPSYFFLPLFLSSSLFFLSLFCFPSFFSS